MAESRINRENYITIQGFMITDLKLKGNELIIYACIYGFTQAEGQTFSGSLQYLADWTNSSKQSVMKCLKSLVEKGLIVKKDNFVNGVKFCEYYTTKLYTLCNKVSWGMQQSCMGGMQQSLPNNTILDNTKDNINNNNSVFANVNEIVDFLNYMAGTSYRAKSKDTQKHIKARLAEGFTVDDFKIVINKKCAEWKGTDFEKYLRPSTLFGTKFENYLNSKGNFKGANGIAVNPNETADDLDGIL